MPCLLLPTPLGGEDDQPRGQNQLVAKPAILVSNPFFVLRIMAKNSAIGQLRKA
jgi:hypothetical protein